MSEHTPIDPEEFTISPLDEVDALELRDFLVSALADFWGERDLTEDHDPYWFRQLASAGLVARHKNEIVGYLLGTIPFEGPAYIHLVAARSDYRHQGIGRQLYDSFIKRARKLGVQSVQATTVPGSSAAISFHSSMGFSGELVEDYAGPDNPRVFFNLNLREE